MYFSKTNMKYFEKARQVSLESDFGKVKVGCIAVYQGHIISSGHNSNKTHPIQFKYDRYRCICDDKNYHSKLHAEVATLNQIRNQNIDFSRVSLYIYRSCNSRAHGYSRPCDSCMHLIKDLGIRRIFYTSDDGFVYEQLN